MNEIIENLYIGDWVDALDAPSEYVRLCVLESKPIYESSIWIPFLDVSGKADKGKLSIIADTIETLLSNGKKVLLHCGAGVERSPLACVWFLHTKRNMEFNKAYELVMEKRPQAADRRLWLVDSGG
jgi:protein-tyrosine phosphatase